MKTNPGIALVHRAAAAALCAGVAGAAAAAAPVNFEGRLAVQLTSELTTGSFAEPSGVPVHQSTLGLRYRGDGWTAQAELPWRRVAGMPESASPSHAGRRFAQQGFGEARLKLVVPLRRAAPDATGVDLVLRARTGSGTAIGGLDTGTAGQSVRLALHRPLRDWEIFGHLGWSRAGSLPGIDPSRHAWQGEFGVSRFFGTRLEAGAFASLRQRVGREPALPEATLYAGVKERDGGWRVFVSRAFAPAWPDVAVGLSYRASF